jgi:intein/homing endonuclease
MSLDLRNLPKEIRDIIEIREATDQTFGRFVDEDYTEIFWNLLSERSDPNVEHSMICSVTGIQGCHLKGTLIQTNDGLKPIESVVAGDLVWAGNAWRPCIPIVKGRQETLRVELRNGLILNMTPDHAMKTPSGWKIANDLRIGDVLVAGNIPWSTEWSEYSERAMVIGMLLADGHLDELKQKQKYDYVRISNRKFKKKPKEIHEWVKKRVRFYNKDPVVHKRFCDALVKHYGATATGRYEDIFKGVRRSTVTCIQNENVFDALVKDGVMSGKKADIVEIPLWIQKDDDAMNGFMAGYFVCDGSYYEKKDGSNGSIEITSCSEKIIRQMQSWFMARGVVTTVKSAPGMNERSMKRWRLFIRQWESLREFIDHIPQISKKMVPRGFDKRKNGTKGHLLEVVKIENGGCGDVFDLHVKDVHEYLAQGLVSHNSGKSMSALAICCYMDPKFNIDRIFFGYDALVNARQMLKPNTAVLVDEQSELFGLDSHRVNIILQNLKEQLRKKSIHFFFCAPTLYPESQTSMYIIETIFIDYETQEVYAALKTRDGLTLGHVRIPYPLKVMEDGTTLCSQELMDAYQAKKDEHLEKVLGNKSVDSFEERAEFVMNNSLFKKAEKIYKRSMGYIPNATVVQIINKIFPEYNAGVVPLEIAGRIKLNKELSGEWEVAGKVTRKDRAGGSGKGMKRR